MLQSIQVPTGSLDVRGPSRRLERYRDGGRAVQRVIHDFVAPALQNMTLVHTLPTIRNGLEPNAPSPLRSTAIEPGGRTTKRPKEPRSRSLRRRCKHLRRHFRSRGPFGHHLLYGPGHRLPTPLVHEFRASPPDSETVVHGSSTTRST